LHDDATKNVKESLEDRVTYQYDVAISNAKTRSIMNTRTIPSAFDDDQKEFWRTHTNMRPYNHPIVQIFAQQRIELIKELLAHTTIESVLDVGCGDGFGMHYMQQLTPRTYGCDYSFAMLLKNPVERNFLCRADAYTLPYADASFHLVNCWELLHHIDNPLYVVKEMARVSRKYILIFEPNCFNPAMALFGFVTSSERRSLRFTPWYLEHLLLQAGLHPLRILTAGCFTPNRTPEWLFKILRRMPYKWPLLGVSNVALASAT